MVTISARSAQALIEAVPRRRFAYFAAAGKVGRPAGRNSPSKRVGATQHVTPTKNLPYGRRGEAKLRRKFFAKLSF